MKTYFDWDIIEDNVIFELDDSRNVKVTYIAEPFRFGRIVNEIQGTTPYYHHYDGNGHTLTITDSFANVVEAFEYTAFGSVVVHVGATLTRLTFGGEYGYQSEVTTADYYIRRRWLSNRVSGWLSIDPLYLWASFSGLSFSILPEAYIYVGQRPLGFLDPSGLKIVEKTLLDDKVDIAKFTPIGEKLGKTPGITVYVAVDNAKCLIEYKNSQTVGTATAKAGAGFSIGFGGTSIDIDAGAITEFNYIAIPDLPMLEDQPLVKGVRAVCCYKKPNGNIVSLPIARKVLDVQVNRDWKIWLGALGTGVANKVTAKLGVIRFETEYKCECLDIPQNWTFLILQSSELPVGDLTVPK